MSKAHLILATALHARALVMLPLAARAQFITGRPPGSGGAAGLPLQQLEQAGPGGAKHGSKSADDTMREAKRKFADADPRVRVQALEELRFVDSPDANELLFRGVADPDVRVRIKGIDVLGARGVTDAVPMMSQELFLRETPAVEKLHLVAALGRIGDQRGAMPIVNYLKETDDSASRGTAVYAIGEIGDPSANDALIQIVSTDPDPMVRKLASEAIEKIDGELPNRHQRDARSGEAKGRDSDRPEACEDARRRR